MIRSQQSVLSTYFYINNLVKFQIDDVYSYVNTIINKDDIKKNILAEIEQKIVLLGNIFNENIHNAFNNII